MVVDGQDTVTTRPLTFPMSVGQSWTIDYVDTTRRGAQKTLTGFGNLVRMPIDAPVRAEAQIKGSPDEIVSAVKTDGKAAISD